MTETIKILCLAVVQGLTEFLPVSSSGLRMRARAMAMRCFYPPESETPRSPTIVS